MFVVRCLVERLFFGALFYLYLLFLIQNDFVKVTGRSDVFMNENFLKERTISAFQVEMKLKLKR